MKRAINISQVFVLLLASLFIAFIPPLFFIYIPLVFLATLAFIIIVIADFATKKQLRKKAGLIVILMYIVAIAATCIFYCMNNYQLIF
jgi:Na+-translocating ferredoxin:NAD+ oxidoreductase RnfA subunit